ncbi:MAG: sugar phosphate isomerase/epimerase family protein [Candidatus Latescibacterota bacterium]|jgi:sugar phosphate isomerase/epimerase
MKKIMTSSWSLHRTLGKVMYDWSDTKADPVLANGNLGGLALLEAPAELARRDIGMLEICHFHLPRLDNEYLDELRAALDERNVDLYSVLIDAGDITHADPTVRAKEVAWVRSFLGVASRLGARCARVIAGDAQPGTGEDLRDDEAVRTSAQNLRALAAAGRDLGVQVITENFRNLGCHAAGLSAILDLCEGEVGLCADFGNFKGPVKYDELSAILPHATSVHAKADFLAEGQMDRDDFARCLERARAADFTGPYSLIFSSAGDEWQGLNWTREVVEEYLV